MNCSMPELLMQLLPVGATAADADCLRCVDAIGTVCLSGADFLDSARRTVEIHVTHCVDIPVAAAIASMHRTTTR